MGEFCHKHGEGEKLYCWGCGVCRSVCPSDALHLVPRTSVPLAANVW